MRIELTKSFPVPLKQAFDYLHDFTQWPQWYYGMIEIVEEPAGGTWRKPGDTVVFLHKVLGHSLVGSVVIEEMREYELIRSVAKVSGLPEVQQVYRFAEAAEGGVELTVTLVSDEPTSFFGRAVDRLLLPHVMVRDLERTMENLGDIFATHIPDPVFWG